MANNFSVVQTVEDGEILLSVLPSKWIVQNGAGNTFDLGYWPVNNRGFRLLEKAKKDPEIPADVQLLRALQCKIKRAGFASFSEAHRALKDMECTSETDDCEDLKPQVKVNNAAKLFAQIQAEHDSVDLNVSSGLDVSAVSQVSEPPAHFSGSVSNVTSFRNELDPPARPQIPPSNVLTIDVFTEAMNSVFAELNAVREENSNIKSLLCQVNAKVDFIGSSAGSSTSGRECEVRLKKVSFAPVRCEEELKSLDEKCRDVNFVKATVKALGDINGKNKCAGGGGSVCLKIVDKLFTREFLTICSWTGVSRSKDEVENCVPKIAFQKFERVIDLFYQIVAYSDPTYPLEKVKSFIHYCLKNSKQRLEHKGIKKPSARKRVKLDSSNLANIDSNDEESGEEAAQEEIIHEEYIDETQ